MKDCRTGLFVTLGRLTQGGSEGLHKQGKTLKSANWITLVMALELGVGGHQAESGLGVIPDIEKAGYGFSVDFH